MPAVIAPAPSERNPLAPAAGSHQARGRLWQRRIDRPLIVVLVAASASAAVAVWLSHTVFSHLSINDDESVYLLQARALAHGHLFPPAPHPAGSFTPWLGVIRGGHYVMKYLPVLPGILALSLVATGGIALALAVMAFGLAIATFGLAVEVTGSRRTSALAVVFMAASPLVIMQSALALPYLPFLLLTELAWWAALSATRTQRPIRYVTAGLVGALAFTLRPYDALLLLLPALAWAIRAGRQRLRLLTYVLAGAAAPLAGMLWYCWTATGSPLRLPFSLFSPQDTLGFGTHRLYPGEQARHFGLAQGWQGLLRHLSLLGGGWAIGGILLLALVVVAVRNYHFAPGMWVIVAGSLLLAAGYLFFWGIWNASILWGGTSELGPYYLLPLLAPASVLGAAGVETAAARSRASVAVVTVGALSISGITLGQALATNAELNAANGGLARLVAAQGRGLFFVDTYPKYLQHPSAVVSNDSPPGGATVYAIDRGAADFAVAKTFPGRPMYRLQLLGEYGHLPHQDYGARLERLANVTAATLSFIVHATASGAAGSTDLHVAVGAERLVIALNRTHNAARVVVDAGNPPARGGGSPAIYDARPTGGVMTLSLVVHSPSGAARTISRLTIPLVLSKPGRLTTLAPVQLVQEIGPLPPPRLTAALTG